MLHNIFEIVLCIKKCEGFPFKTPFLTPLHFSVSQEYQLKTLAHHIYVGRIVTRHDFNTNNLINILILIIIIIKIYT